MSFADELRNAPNEQKEKESLQAEQDWNDFISAWYKEIQERCKYYAKKNEHSYNANFSNFIESIQEYSSLYSYSLLNVWERIRERIACYESSRYVAYLTEEDAQELINRITKLLQADELAVSSQIIKFKVYRTETKYIKRDEKSSAQIGLLNTLFPLNKMNLHEDGYFKKETIEDGYRCNIELDIHW